VLTIIIRAASYPPYGEGFQRKPRPDFTSLFAEPRAEATRAPATTPPAYSDTITAPTTSAAMTVATEMVETDEGTAHTAPPAGTAADSASVPLDVRATLRPEIRSLPRSASSCPRAKNMAAVTTFTRERTRDLSIANIALGERIHTPTQKQIDEMATSLANVGQLSPIMVHPVARNAWRIVAGNKRLLAAFKLGWTHLRADIICGQTIDYKIIELTENAERRSLTAAQRRAAKAELKQLIRDRMAGISTTKGGRGNKGGNSQAARELS
jgi:ParB/Sulfiredoxin domain